MPANKFFPHIRAIVALTALLGALAFTGCFDSSTGPKQKGPPVITQHPDNDTVEVGDVATFTVTATGSGLTYKWVRGTSDTLAGQTSDTLVLQNVSDSLNGTTYKCVVRNSKGFVVSDEATLTVETNPPAITQQPDSVVTVQGANVTFTVTASGGGLTYKWVRGTSDTLAGQTSDTLALQNVGLALNGTTYKCVVRNSAGSVVSNAAMLAVYDSLYLPKSFLLDTGAAIFSFCANCHGTDGQGGGAPLLRNSDFVMADKIRTIRILLRGNRDSIRVNGQFRAGGGMPSWNWLSNVEIASVLTYVRAVLNDTLMSGCVPVTEDEQPNCSTRTPRNPADIAADSVAVWQVKAVRDTLTPFPEE